MARAYNIPVGEVASGTQEMSIASSQNAQRTRQLSARSRSRSRSPASSRSRSRRSRSPHSRRSRSPSRSVSRSFRRRSRSRSRSPARYQQLSGSHCSRSASPVIRSRSPSRRRTRSRSRGFSPASPERSNRPARQQLHHFSGIPKDPLARGDDLTQRSAGTQMSEVPTVLDVRDDDEEIVKTTLQCTPAPLAPQAVRRAHRGYPAGAVDSSHATCFLLRPDCHPSVTPEGALPDMICSVLGCADAMYAPCECGRCKPLLYYCAFHLPMSDALCPGRPH